MNFNSINDILNLKKQKSRTNFRGRDERDVKDFFPGFLSGNEATWIYPLRQVRPRSRVWRREICVRICVRKSLENVPNPAEIGKSEKNKNLVISDTSYKLRRLGSLRV